MVLARKIEQGRLVATVEKTVAGVAMAGQESEAQSVASLPSQGRPLKELGKRSQRLAALNMSDQSEQLLVPQVLLPKG